MSCFPMAKSQIAVLQLQLLLQKAIEVEVLEFLAWTLCSDVIYKARRHKALSWYERYISINILGSFRLGYTISVLLPLYSM